MMGSIGETLPQATVSLTPRHSGEDAWRVPGSVLLAAVGIVTLLGLVLASASATAEGHVGAGDAPWWGPSDEQEPTVGYHFRVPLLVSNPHGYALEDPVAFAEVDVGERLIEAGWNAQSLGAAEFPTSFTLNPDSVRVVPYERGFSSIASQDPSPSRFYEGRFSVEAEGSFDAARNPVGTIAFQLEGSLAPGETRAFMAYFASEEQGEREPDERPAPVDAWPSRGWGTSSFGFPPVDGVGVSPKVDVVAGHEATSVEVFTYEGGQPQPARLPDLGNPFSLEEGESATFEPPSRTFFKVEASKPVLVGERGGFSSSFDSFGGGAFVPSTSGSYRGSSFLVPAYAPTIVVSTAELGSTEVTVTTGDETTSTSLGTGQPFASFELSVDEHQDPVPVASVSSSELPVVVQYGPPVLGVHDAPSATGSATGEDVRVVAPDGNELRVTSQQATGVRVLEGAGSSQQLVPFGDVGSTPPREVSGFPDGVRVATNESFPEEDPIRVVSTSTGDVDASPVRVSVGSGERAGAFLPDASLSTPVEGSVAVLGAFDGTRVTYESFPLGGEPTEETRTLNADGVAVFEAEPTLEGARVTVSKPASVVPTDALDRYARLLPGHGPGLDASVGSLQFRGALVQMDMEQAVGGQAVETIGPGQSISFDASVANVGHWTRGAQITEEVTLSCSEVPQGWSVDGCGRSFSLASGQRASAELEVAASEDVRPGERLSLTLEAKGERWNTTDSAQVVLLVRTVYNVDAWFHAEGGPRDLRDAPVFVDRDGQALVPVVVKNTGTVEDTYRLDKESSSEGWSVEARQEGEAVDALTLDAEETAQLVLRVQASEDPTMHSTPLGLEVASTSDELTFATLRGRAQIATELNVTMDAPEPVALVDPGQTHAFPLNVTNHGDSIVSVRLNATPSMPDGWTVDVPVPQISVFPDNRTELNVTLTTPPEANAEQRGTVSALVSAARSPGEQPTEQRRVLTALVRHVHDLAAPTDPIPVDAGPHAEINLPLENRGNANETVRVLGTNPAWGFTTPGPIEVPANGTATLPLELDVPPTTTPGDTNLTLHVDLSRSTQRNLTLPLDVRPTPRLEATLVEPRPVMPGKPTTIPTVLTSAGNQPLTGEPTLQTPGDWPTNSTPATVDLDPGESANVTFTLHAPETAPTDAATITPTVHPAEGAPVTDEPFTLPSGETDLALQGARLEELPTGDLLVRTQLVNNGSVPAYEALVALQAGDQELDSTTVQRLSPGEAATVSLSTPASDATPLRLTADPLQALADPDRSDNELVLDDASQLPAPFAALAIVAGAFIARGWRP